MATGASPGLSFSVVESAGKRLALMRKFSTSTPFEPRAIRLSSHEGVSPHPGVAFLRINSEASLALPLHLKRQGT